MRALGVEYVEVLLSEVLPHKLALFNDVDAYVLCLSLSPCLGVLCVSVCVSVCVFVC